MRNSTHNRGRVRWGHVGIVAILSAIVAPAAAHATSITLTDPTSFLVTFDGSSGGNGVSGLSAQAEFDFLGFSDNGSGDTNASFNVSITNTSSSPVTDSRVTALGFDAGSALIGGSASGVFDKVVFGGSLPDGFGSVDACVTTNSCDGLGGGGIQLGDTGTLSLLLTLSGSVDSLTLSNFGVRYRSISNGSLKNDDGIGNGTNVSNVAPLSAPLDPVPEPATLTMLGTGLGFVGHRLRRRRANG